MVDTSSRSLGGREDVLPQLIGARESLLVGGYDADALAQGEGVQLGNVLGAGVVDENGLSGGLGKVLDDLGKSEGGLGGGSEGIDDVVKVNGRVVVVVDGLAARGNVGETQLRGRSPSSEGLELVNEDLADTTGAYFCLALIVVHI